MAHTSTSPNYQILASLDLGRRQVALEGFELVQRQIENAMQLRDAIDNHPLLSKYMRCLSTADLIPDEFRPSGIDQPLRSGLRNMMAAWEADEFVLDPSRITLSIGAHRLRRRHVQARSVDGPARRADQQDVAQHRAVHDEHRHHPQLGGVPDRGAGQDRPGARRAHLGDEPGRAQPVRAAGAPPDRRVGAAARLQRLPRASATSAGAEAHAGGRRAPGVLPVLRRRQLRVPDRDEIDEKLDAGIDVVSATFVTPYPPGFPVLVPGQMFSREILSFIRDLDTPEVHGYQPDFGYRVYTDKAIEMCRPTDAQITNGHVPVPADPPEPAPTVDTSEPSTRKTGTKRSGKPPEPAQMS